MDKIKIDNAFVEKVAKTAKLKLTDKEKETLIKDFNEILKTFSKLDEVKTDNVKPSFHPISEKNMLREDKAHKSITEEEAFSNTKNKSDKYFKGPKVV